MPRRQNFDRKKDNMLFTLSTDPEFSLLTEHTESRRLHLADSWAPKPSLCFLSKTFQERVDLPFGMRAQGQDIVKFSSGNLFGITCKITCSSELQGRNWKHKADTLFITFHNIEVM